MDTCLWNDCCVLTVTASFWHRIFVSCCTPQYTQSNPPDWCIVPKVIRFQCKRKSGICCHVYRQIRHMYSIVPNRPEIAPGEQSDLEAVRRNGKSCWQWTFGHLPHHEWACCLEMPHKSARARTTRRNRLTLLRGNCRFPFETSSKTVPTIKIEWLSSL